MNHSVKVYCMLFLVLLILSCDKSDEASIHLKPAKEADNSERILIGNDILSKNDKLSPESTTSIENKDETSVTQDRKALSKFTSVEWIDLIPEDDLNALQNPPEYIYEVAEGSEDDQISAQIQNKIAADSEDRYMKALVSTRVVEDMDKKAIRIPGFVVPVEFDGQQTVTQFFLVPFFGACLHMPPPPPNQIIFVNSLKGLKLESLYQPYWISGELNVSLTKNELATSAYTMDMHEYQPFSE